MRSPAFLLSDIRAAKYKPKQAKIRKGVMSPVRCVKKHSKMSAQVFRRVRWIVPRECAKDIKAVGNIAAVSVMSVRRTSVGNEPTSRTKLTAFISPLKKYRSLAMVNVDAASAIIHVDPKRILASAT